MPSPVESTGPGKRFPASRLALLAVMLACALALGLAERAMPPVAALPGVRLGLPNVAILLALYLFSLPETIILALCKCVMLSLLSGGSFPSLLFSLSGTSLSLIAMVPLVRLSRGRVGPLGVSVSGAVCHNIGQMLCHAALMGVFLTPYLPLMLVSGAVAGVATGLVVAAIHPRLKRFGRILYRDRVP